MEHWNRLVEIARRRGTGYTTALSHVIDHGAFIATVDQKGSDNVAGLYEKHRTEVGGVKRGGTTNARHYHGFGEFPIIPDNQLLYRAVQEAEEAMRTQAEEVKRLNEVLNKIDDQLQKLKSIMTKP